MLVRNYKIVDVKRFEVYIEDISTNGHNAIVRIDKGAICKADLRYYLGSRDKRTLDLKYPLRLIHEATGTVLKDHSKNFLAGDLVTLVPNLCCFCPHPNCQISSALGENYCPHALFASSNYDGFSSEIISIPAQNLVKIRNSSSYYVFCELVSVAIAATKRVNITPNSRIVVFGDGLLGYILCAVLKELHSCTIFVVGKHKEKLKMFTMCDNLYMSSDCRALSRIFEFGFECIGGIGAEAGVNTLIDLIDIGGRIIMTGVTEDNIKINTRKILEKGITLTGSTRSTVNDFEIAVSLFEHSTFKKYIECLILEEIKIRSIDDYYLAFETESNNTKLGKNILIFD